MNDLIQARDAAWKAFADFDAEEWAPRQYKRRKGQGKVHINPFTSMEELEELSTRRRRLFLEFLSLHHQMYREGLSSPLPVLWVIEHTPDGERYRRYHG